MAHATPQSRNKIIPNLYFIRKQDSLRIYCNFYEGKFSEFCHSQLPSPAISPATCEFYAVVNMKKPRIQELQILSQILQKGNFVCALAVIVNPFSCRSESNAPTTNRAFIISLTTVLYIFFVPLQYLRRKLAKTVVVVYCSP